MPTTAARSRAQVRWLCCVALFAASSTGCCSFEMNWHAAKRQPPPCDNLAGLWEGTWESNYNGHDGKLRAIITPCGPGRYRAQYHATFAFVVPYAYETIHTASEQGGVTYFSGVQDLGPLAGGVYRYNGRADGETFVASYRADKDHGVFRMRRVCSGGGCACGCRSGNACDSCDCAPTGACAAMTIAPAPGAASELASQPGGSIEPAPLSPGFASVADSE